MGTEPKISSVKFPRQGKFLGKPVRVCFHYDTSHSITGRVVRDDADAPGLMIIRLDNGSYVLSTECQYQLIKEPQ